jgi:histidinol-phosphate aminotransferase
MLDDNLNFNLKTLPALHSNSVLIITAPNNPTGTNISMKQLENILKQNPTALIVLDGVYCEFSKTDFTPLINQYENLMVLRSFSKAFPVAGLRLGYLCASATITANVKAVTSICHQSVYIIVCTLYTFRCKIYARFKTMR